MKLRVNTQSASPWLALLLCLVWIPAFAESPSVLITSAKVEKRQLKDTLVSFGVLEPDPNQILSLSLPHAGLINRVWVRLGQRVKAGDALLEVITSPDARMQFLQAESAVDYSTRELARKQRLFSEQLATKADVDAARKAKEDSIAALNALKQQGVGVEKETVRAPMAGIITRLDVSQGQRIQSGTAAMLIAAEQRLIARLGIEPEDLARVRPGIPVVIRSVFVPNTNIEAKVGEVHAMVDPVTKLVEVLAPIPDKKVDHLVLGSRVIAELKLNSVNALVVPRSAVLWNGDHAHVFTVESGKARRIPVTPGIESGNWMAVSGSLKPGDTVVTSGNYELSDGMATREAP